MKIEALRTRFTCLGADDGQAFEQMAQAAQSYQRTHCRVYGQYGLDYLPVEAFKHASVTTFPPDQAEVVFESSRTGSTVASRHYVRYADVYARSVCANFAATMGRGPYTILAHLPGYASQTSSLVYMVQLLMDQFGASDSSFFLEDWSPLERAITYHAAPLVLIGAAFGLLDLVEQHKWHLPAGSIVIETGGMKTYRRSITRNQLHMQIAEGFGVAQANVWSEYGMCELMSQAYAKGGEIYDPPPWMRVRVVDPLRPERVLPEGESGALAIIDLANMYSVSWLLTEDMGVQRGAGFEVLGRLPTSALRGCNFLIPST